MSENKLIFGGWDVKINERHKWLIMWKMEGNGWIKDFLSSW